MKSCPYQPEEARGDTWIERLDARHPAQGEAICELRNLLCAFLTQALRHQGEVNHFFIDDMAQETLLKILEKKHTFNGRSAFTTWAYSIAIRTALSERRRRHWGNLSLDTLREAGSAPEPQDQKPEPASGAMREELRRSVVDLIQTCLTPAQRDVLLAELNGMPQDEIARQTGRTRNAVYKLFHDARSALKKELASRGITAATLAEVYQGKDS